MRLGGRGQKERKLNRRSQAPTQRASPRILIVDLLEVIALDVLSCTCSRYRETQERVGLLEANSDAPLNQQECRAREKLRPRAEPLLNPAGRWKEGHEGVACFMRKWRRAAAGTNWGEERDALGPTWDLYAVDSKI